MAVLDTLAGIHIGVSVPKAEAKITDNTRARVLEAIAEEPLLMTDVLSDCVGEFQELYNLAQGALSGEITLNILLQNKDKPNSIRDR